MGFATRRNEPDPVFITFRIDSSESNATGAPLDGFEKPARQSTANTQQALEQG
jgi:hypothetical protein